MFPEVDPLLGPEMRSTGEVLGIADSFGLAFFKAEEATQIPLLTSGTVLISVSDQDKPAILEVAKDFAKLGFDIKATEGTHSYLAKHGVTATVAKKINDGRPNIVDAIMNKEISLVINTPIGKQSKNDDSYIRKTAIKYKIPYLTTVAAAVASVKGIASYKEAASQGGEVKPLQEYHRQNLDVAKN
jgi:carbamoyl-phosphate synthase large subunit